MPLAGLEPARGFPQQILNLLRLPFRHSDIANQECIPKTFQMVVAIRNPSRPRAMFDRYAVNHELANIASPMSRYFLFFKFSGLILGTPRVREESNPNRC